MYIQSPEEGVWEPLDAESRVGVSCMTRMPGSELLKVTQPTSLTTEPPPCLPLLSFCPLTLPGIETFLSVTANLSSF